MLATPDIACGACIGAFALLIFYGGLISISDEVFDSSKVDGANGLTRFWHIDLPMMMGQMPISRVPAANTPRTNTAQ